MNPKVLAFVEKLELFKTKIKALHWDSDSLSQHELCDDIADSIAEFQDQVSEVEQSISGKLAKNLFRPENQEFGEVGTLKEFVEDVIEKTNKFYKELEGMGDKYIGMRSDCESFLSDMQRKLYLVNFTIKEELKQRLIARLNESRPKNPQNVVDIDKFMGRKPKSMKGRINQIYKIVKLYGIDSRKYHDEHWQAVDDYQKAISSLGCEVDIYPCANLNKPEWDIQSDGGYCDYDPSDHMPRSKQYKVDITFDDGMRIGGYAKMMACGTVDDPFSSYDTCLVLWPKSNSVLEGVGEIGGQMRLTEAELKQVVKEAAMKILSETPLNYDIDNFSGKWTKGEPNWDEYVDDEGYLDNPYAKEKIEYDLWDDAFENGDMRPMEDIENDYSWDLFDRKPIAQGLDDYYKVGKGVVGREVDNAISMRNRKNDWNERELRNRDRMMGKWLGGKRDADQIGDAWDDLHYECKEPMRVTEEELKTVIKEAAMKLVKEYTQKQANTKGFIRSTHGHRNGFKKQVTPEERAESRRRLGIKDEVDESIDIDPKNKGKFTATKKATGKSTEELAHSKNPLTRKRANFARMAKRHWKPLKKSE